VGDEPWQYYGWFGGLGVAVAVAENRQLGLDLLRQHHPETTVVVLDDAYQHRRVQPTLNILLTEWARPFSRDYVLPAGRLRESRAGAARAEVVIVTKCPPDLTAAAQAALAAELQPYLQPAVPVLFSSYAYAPPQPLTSAAVALGAPAPPGPVGLLTGIAQPGPLREHLQAVGYQITENFEFADHHAFTPAELAGVAARLPAGLGLFTTEKDAARLAAPELRAVLAGRAVYTIPVRVALLGSGAAELGRRVAAAVGPPA
jgi:tetraacyldisaccharide 4'-kinase